MFNKHWCVVRPETDYIQVYSLRSDTCQVDICDSVEQAEPAQVQLTVDGVRGLIADLQYWLDEINEER